MELNCLRPDGETAAAPTWLHRVPEPSHDAVTRALEQWMMLGHPAIADQLPDILAEVTSLLGQIRPTFIHGDCHVDNLLSSADGQLVWVDWQEVAFGAGPEDLTLLWQRAEFDGARPPRSAMMAAYCAARGTVPDQHFECVVLAAELRLLLLEWPHFIPYGQQRQQRTMINRLRASLSQWGA